MGDPHAPDDAADWDLMKQVAQDDEHALRRLVGRYQGLLVNFFLRSGAQSFAEDLVQETFIRLYRYRHRAEPRARFTTFLHTLARHVWVDHVRRGSRATRLREAWQAEQPDADTASAAAAGVRLDAARALQELPDEPRAVVTLLFFQGLSQAEAAEVLGIPVGTVKSRLFNALQRLRGALDEPR
jgi:RNA polymerase sigma-70 factor, ECF subfamily